MISFQWMVREAEKAGLLVDDAKMNALLAQCRPNPRAEMHESLNKEWKDNRVRTCAAL
jgi:hypothetical protein